MNLTLDGRPSDARALTAALLGTTLAVLGGCANMQVEPGDPEYTAIAPVERPPVVYSNGSVFQYGYTLALFEDPKARNVGDMLTVILTERTEAAKSASTSTDKGSDIEIPNPTIFGDDSITINDRLIFQNQIESQTEFEGEGDSDQSNRLSGTLTVTVAQVLPNGNFVVQGEKWIGINQGEEFVRLRGIVRPIDITKDNTVLSTQVADAQIYYRGKGAVADSNTQGWGTRFFTSPIWPF
jgi:flagellar L-ring protein precursor FlgH